MRSLLHTTSCSEIPMCQRKENEPFLAYICRWAVESFVHNPVSVVCIFCLGFSLWMYRDMVSIMYKQAEHVERQTPAYMQMVTELREMNIRLQNIELNFQKKSD